MPAPVWASCQVCGRDFMARSPGETVCPDKKRHAEIATAKRDGKGTPNKRGK